MIVGIFPLFLAMLQGHSSFANIEGKNRVSISDRGYVDMKLF